VRLLLDTHTLLWWWNKDRRLSASAAAIILRSSNRILVSAVSAWEVATKHRIGRLPELKRTVDEFLPFVEDEGFELIGISPEHAIRGGSYQAAHGDPFDRLLAAQSELEDAPLLTRDAAFTQFPCKTLW
jgi:PIN domain nuclease of toxin-antitoxin system